MLVGRDKLEGDAFIGEEVLDELGALVVTPKGCRGGTAAGEVVEDVVASL